MLSTEFLITSLVVVLIPGTGVIYTISSGLFMGFRASVAAAIGCTLGITPHLLASILGLSAILHMSAIAFQLVKYAGTGYLLYLAWSMWRDTGSLNFDKPESKNNLIQIAIKGFLINILNPKLSIFFLAFLPLFVAPESSSPMIQMLILSAIFMLMTLCIFILYGASAHSVRSYVINSPKITLRLQKTFAVIFAALGAKLALTEQ
ncbi:MAG: LysE family translocator [Candidatus Omnitrophica bacterium]|nr:LysE family translocator [Candidatus Omnitrophota bacterium]